MYYLFQPLHFLVYIAARACKKSGYDDDLSVYNSIDYPIASDADAIIVVSFPLYLFYVDRLRVLTCNYL